MKSIVMVIILCATVAFAGDWNKEYDTQMEWVREILDYPPTIFWKQIPKMGKPGQILQYDEKGNPPIKWVDPKIDQIIITDLDYVDKICFEIENTEPQSLIIANKRCVNVKWLYEFLGMMGR